MHSLHYGSREGNHYFVVLLRVGVCNAVMTLFEQKMRSKHFIDKNRQDDRENTQQRWWLCSVGRACGELGLVNFESPIFRSSFFISNTCGAALYD